MSALLLCDRCGADPETEPTVIELMIKATCIEPGPGHERDELVQAMRDVGADDAADWYVAWELSIQGRSAAAVEQLASLRERTTGAGDEYWHVMAIALLAYHPEAFGPSEGAVLLVKAADMLESSRQSCTLTWFAHNQIAIGWAVQSMTQQAQQWFESGLELSRCRVDLGTRSAAEANIVHMDLELAVEALALDELADCESMLALARSRAELLVDSVPIDDCPAMQMLRDLDDQPHVDMITSAPPEDVTPMAAIAYLKEYTDAREMMDAAWARHGSVSSTHRIALARLRHYQAVRESPADTARLERELLAQMEVGMRRFRTQRVDAVMGLERAQSERTLLRRNASTDELTGLMNRRGFVDRLRLEISQVDVMSPTLAVLVLDLDGFKHINDRYGHALGDEALRVVGQVLAGRLRAHDVVARWGGDEFGVVAPRLRRRADAENLLARLEAAVGGEVALADPRLSEMSISGGVGWYEPGDDALSLFARADSALIARKAESRTSPAGASVRSLPREPGFR